MQILICFCWLLHRLVPLAGNMDTGPNCKNKSRCPETWKNLIQPSTLFSLVQGTSTWRCRSCHSNTTWNAWPAVTDNFLCCAWLLVPVSLNCTMEESSAPTIHTEIISHGNHETFFTFKNAVVRDHLYWDSPAISLQLLNERLKRMWDGIHHVLLQILGLSPVWCQP